MGTCATVCERHARRGRVTTSERKLTSYNIIPWYTTTAKIIIIIITVAQYCTDTPVPVASRWTTMMSRSLKMAIFHTGFDTAPPPLSSVERKISSQLSDYSIPNIILLCLRRSTAIY